MVRTSCGYVVDDPEHIANTLAVDNCRQPDVALTVNPAPACRKCGAARVPTKSGGWRCRACDARYYLEHRERFAGMAKWRNDRRRALRPPPPTLEQRFWSKVSKGDGCWLWTGATGGSGYGQQRRDGVIVAAHRFAWELANGSIPDGLCCCHRCDVRLCVRLDHLFLGTQVDNMQDASKKGRLVLPDPRRGERNNHAKLTEASVREIRRMLANGVRNKTWIGARFGVTRKAVHCIAAGLTWRHVS